MNENYQPQEVFLDKKVWEILKNALVERFQVNTYEEKDKADEKVGWREGFIFRGVTYYSK